MLVIFVQNLVLIRFAVVVLVKIADFGVMVLVTWVLGDGLLLLGRYRSLFLELLAICLKFNGHINLWLRNSCCFSLLTLKIESLNLQCLLTTLGIHPSHA